MFNKEEYKKKMKPHVDKLVAQLKKKGIFFVADKGIENVMFHNNKKEVIIAHNCFYRYSGIAFIHREKGASFIEYVEVTDDMWMQQYMKQIIEINLFIS